jgi:hypothetical protein
MIWWFLVLGVSTLVVVGVAIALFLHLRRHLQKAHSVHDEAFSDSEHGRQTGRVRH